VRQARTVPPMPNGLQLTTERRRSALTPIGILRTRERRSSMSAAGGQEAGAEGFAGGARNEVAVIARDNPALFEQIATFAVQTC
jgi:hypothetical protein